MYRTLTEGSRNGQLSLVCGEKKDVFIIPVGRLDPQYEKEQFGTCLARLLSARHSEVEEKS